MPLYKYVGPPEIRDAVADNPMGKVVDDPAAVFTWITHDRPSADQDGLYVATFVVDFSRTLRIASRHSEHVQCAGGGPVFTAGEMAFCVEHKDLSIEWASNQSTGYCPEPDSFSELAKALYKAGIEPPAGFDPAIVFRRCPQCGERNIVKDDWFVCDICGAELPPNWNF